MSSHHQAPVSDTDGQSQDIEHDNHHDNDVDDDVQPLDLDEHAQAQKHLQNILDMYHRVGHDDATATTAADGPLPGTGAEDGSSVMDVDVEMNQGDHDSAEQPTTNDATAGLIAYLSSRREAAD